MWVYLRDSFLSIVSHRDDPNCLLVRARKSGDIKRAFPDAVETHTPRADYHYRATIPREQVGEVLARQALSIPYDNFKAAVPDRARHDAYLDCWATMLRWGRGEVGQD
jgi:hypothetical protein